MNPSKGFFEETKADSLDVAMSKYFESIESGVSDQDHYVTISQGYGAFPYYEKSEVGEVLTKLCTDRGGKLKADEEIKGLDAYASFENKLQCINTEKPNAGMLTISHNYRTIYMSFISDETIEKEKNAKKLALKKSEEQKKLIAERIKLAKEKAKKKCLKDTEILIENLSEGDYSIQGLIVQVKDKIALAQDGDKSKWYPIQQLESKSCDGIDY
jgi:hypothetical protein